uniref:Uncharacterized protein n=1 Tax=Anguilla anguilla TaxID=7936 RepID=A0A0E9U3F6_ANGAN
MALECRISHCIEDLFKNRKHNGKCRCTRTCCIKQDHIFFPYLCPASSFVICLNLGRITLSSRSLHALLFGCLYYPCG